MTKDAPIHHPDKTEEGLRHRYDALVEYASFDDAAYQWAFDQLGISLQPADRVLDVGCGRGTFCHFVERAYGVAPVGVDYSLPRIEAARRLAGEGSKAVFWHQTLQEYFRTPPQKVFDYIASFEVFEHLEDPHAALNLCKQHARIVLGSLPLNHPSVSHIWDFPTMASLQNYLGAEATLVPKEGSYRVFFVVPGAVVDETV
jgi:cyclopropane fatty-acyl-phospholipid synthase-like methyltransferase